MLLRYHVSCRVFDKTSNHSGDSAPLQPRVGTLRLLAFPKIKITLEREEISDSQWDSGKYDTAADGNWKNCVRIQGAYFEGDWGIIVLCTMFLISCIFFNKCLFFIVCGWILSGQTYIYLYVIIYVILHKYTLQYQSLRYKHTHNK